MRLGILGPANGDVVGLARAAQLLLDGAHAERVIYLAPDGALERVVVSWAQDLVRGNPFEEALFQRAAARCGGATPAEIDDFVDCERARLRLKVLTSLPSEQSRSIEILDGRVVLFVYDKAMLDEDDIVAAHLLIFGKSPEPLIRKVGARVFLSPGPIGSAGGAAILDDDNGGIHMEILGPSGKVTARDQIGGPRPGKMRVQGGP